MCYFLFFWVQYPPPRSLCTLDEGNSYNPSHNDYVKVGRVRPILTPPYSLEVPSVNYNGDRQTPFDEQKWKIDKGAGKFWYNNVTISITAFPLIEAASGGSQPTEMKCNEQVTGN